MSPRAEIETFPDAEALARHAAVWFCEYVNSGVLTGQYGVCLSGGTTPRRLYELLAERPLAARMPWPLIHWFFGDERFVPHDHPASNYRMVREALFSRAPIPADHIHPVLTGRASPEEAAEAYEQTLRDFRRTTLGAAADERPLFAVTLLGLGEDGHTASLFPGQATLDEMRRWAVAVEGKPQRVSLTFPVLDSSAEAAFLVSGQSKREILARVLRGEPLPAGRIRPVGRLHWFADRAAFPAETTAPLSGDAT